MKYRVVLIIALLLGAFQLDSSYGISNPIATEVLIRGKVVSKNGRWSLKYLYIKDGVFQKVSKKRPKVSKGTAFVSLNGFIYPGLSDLHSHSTYNFMPLWSETAAQFKNRFEWRKNKHYKKIFREAWKTIAKNKKDPSLFDAAILFSEMQAISGGTTLLQQSHELEPEKEIDEQGNEIDPEKLSANEITKSLVVRGTDFANDLNLAEGEKIISVIDLYGHRVPKPRGKGPKAKGSLKLLEYGREALRDGGKLKAFIPHLGEGRTGFLVDHNENGILGDDFDPYSRQEFEAFMNDPMFVDDTAPKPPVALIHCSGIDPQNDDHIDFMKKWNMGIVWSPVSNLLLYGDTLDVETLMKKGITIALGSDWSPSGSKHVLDEARFAKFYLNTIGAKVTDAQIFQMVTTNSAKLLGLSNYGQIKEGNLADLFVLTDPSDRKHSAMSSLFYTDTRFVTLVMIGGKAVYGYKDLVHKLNPLAKSLPKVEGSSVKNKVFYADPKLGFDFDRDIGKIESTLDAFEVTDEAILKSSGLSEPVLGIKRSNLLSSSDKFYQQRLIALSFYVQFFFSDKYKDLNSPKEE